MPPADSKPPVVFLMGPTASGKTAVAMQLYRQLKCRLISVDSSLVYRGMDIGTAKPSRRELTQAPHALIDIRDPEATYSVAEFCRDARQHIQDAQSDNVLPILVGGTMMYFNALDKGLAEMPSADPVLRSRLQKILQEQGLPALHERLKMIDPATASRVHPNDPQRILRALEVHALTGKPISEWQRDTALSSLANDCTLIRIALFPQDRTLLHQRIEQRFDQMLEDGFLQEVEGLRRRAGFHVDQPSMRSVGYRQALQFLQGEVDHEKFRHRAIVASRQLAKRQMTWLRGMDQVVRFDSSQLSENALLSEILNAIVPITGEQFEQPTTRI